MKIRTGFVSNSSSASFVLKKRGLSALQLRAVLNYAECTHELLRNEEEGQYAGGWTLTQDDRTIKGDTMMDNFDFEWFLDAIGVPKRNYQYQKDG